MYEAGTNQNAKNTAPKGTRIHEVKTSTRKRGATRRRGKAYQAFQEQESATKAVQPVVAVAVAEKETPIMASNKQYQGNSDGNVWMNDPNERDPLKTYGTPPDPRMVRAQRASTFASLGHGASPEANAQLKIILGSLNDMEGTLGYPYAYIRNTMTDEQVTQTRTTLTSGGQGGSTTLVRRVLKRGVTSDQRANAQKSLDAQREIVQRSSTVATDAFNALKPRVLADIIVKPAHATDAQISDRKADLLAAIERAGKVAGNAQAQAFIRQAVTDGDALTIYVLCGDPLKFRAADLGLNQQTLQQVYAQAQMAKVGPKPIDSIGDRAIEGTVPGGELIQVLPELQALISETGAAVTQSLNALAQECGLR